MCRACCDRAGQIGEQVTPSADRCLDKRPDQQKHKHIADQTNHVGMQEGMRHQRPERCAALVHDQCTDAAVQQVIDRLSRRLPALELDFAGRDHPETAQRFAEGSVGLDRCEEALRLALELLQRHLGLGRSLLRKPGAVAGEFDRGQRACDVRLLGLCLQRGVVALHRKEHADADQREKQRCQRKATQRQAFLVRQDQHDCNSNTDGCVDTCVPWLMPEKDDPARHDHARPATTDTYRARLYFGSLSTDMKWRPRGFGLAPRESHDSSPDAVRSRRPSSGGYLGSFLRVAPRLSGAATRRSQGCRP